jgi:hypothetical protein
VKVIANKFPGGGESINGNVDGATRADYHISRVSQTNLVLIIMDSWQQTSKNFQCGVLAPRCPDVTVPTADTIASSRVCVPPESFYYKNFSVLEKGGVATTQLSSLSLLQKNLRMCGSTGETETTADSSGSVLVIGLIVVAVLVVAACAYGRKGHQEDHDGKPTV